jgi:hypothetical protein
MYLIFFFLLSTLIVSQGFECCGIREYGNYLDLPLVLPSKTYKFIVGFSSWACVTGGWNTFNCNTPNGSTFNLNVTFNIRYRYQTIPALSKTLLLTFPYRPSLSIGGCLNASFLPDGRWQDSFGVCKNGLLHFQEVSFTGISESRFAFSVAYETDSVFASKSLNVALYGDSVEKVSVYGNMDPTRALILETNNYECSYAGSTCTPPLPANVSITNRYLVDITRADEYERMLLRIEETQ